jgi:hypothetical protein
LGKSSLARWLFLREIGRNPRLRTVVISADSTDASNSVSLCRQILLSPAYQQTFPEVKPDYERSMDARGWKMGEWFLRAAGQRKDPTMAAKACIPKGESMRVDLLLADDVMTRRTSEEPFRSQLTDSFFKTWIDGRLSNGGWCIYLQNVWNDQDLGHRLREHPGFCSLWIGINDSLDGLFVKVWHPPEGLRIAEQPQDFGLAPDAPDDTPPACQLRFTAKLPAHRVGLTPEALHQREPSSLVQLYQLRATKPSDLMLPSWDRRVSLPLTAPELLGVKEDRRGLPVMTYSDRMRFSLAAGLDLSSTKRKGSALWVLAKDAKGVIFPAEVHVGAWTVAEIVALFRDLEQRGIMPTIIYVENNGIQDLIVKALSSFADKGEGDEWAKRVEPFVTGRNKSDPQVGLPALEADISQGVIHWPSLEATRDTLHARDWSAFDRVALTLPRHLLPQMTPDTIMGFWFARRALDRLGAPGRGIPPETGVRTYRDETMSRF